jgi:hypothetical protein
VTVINFKLVQRSRAQVKRKCVEVAVVQQQSDLDCVRDDHSYVSYAIAFAVKYSYATDSYFALFDYYGLCSCR